MVFGVTRFGCSGHVCSVPYFSFSFLLFLLPSLFDVLVARLVQFWPFFFLSLSLSPFKMWTPDELWLLHRLSAIFGSTVVVATFHSSFVFFSSLFSRAVFRFCFWHFLIFSFLVFIIVKEVMKLISNVEVNPQTRNNERAQVSFFFFFFFHREMIFWIEEDLHPTMSLKEGELAVVIRLVFPLLKSFNKGNMEKVVLCVGDYVGSL